MAEGNLLTPVISPSTLAVDDNTPIYLRLTRIEDAEELAQLVEVNRNFLKEYQPWALSYTAEKSQEKIAGVIQKIANGEWLQYRIVNKDTNKIIGTLTFYDHDLVKRIAKLGYWLAEDMQGKGFAFSGAKRLLLYGFEEWNLEHVVLEIQDTNERSIHLAQKLGAKRTETVSKNRMHGIEAEYRQWVIERAVYE